MVTVAPLRGSASVRGACPLMRAQCSFCFARTASTCSAPGLPLLPSGTRLIKGRAIEEVVRHQHEAGPHNIGCSDPYVIAVIDAVLIARMMVQRAFVPNHEVPVLHRARAGDIVCEISGSKLDGTVWRDPKV